MASTAVCASVELNSFAMACSSPWTVPFNASSVPWKPRLLMAASAVEKPSFFREALMLLEGVISPDKTALY